MTLLPLLRLLQLASPALPIGGYSYSQGLEWVVETGVIRDEATAEAWIGDALELVMGRGEAPVAARLLSASVLPEPGLAHAWHTPRARSSPGTDSPQVSDWAAFAHWNAWFRASRETAELRSETEQMGAALATLAVDLDLLDPAARAALAAATPITLPAAFALAARGFDIEAANALAGYIWTWLENQVLCAMKLVPLGQRAGQRMLKTLAARVPPVVTAAMAIADDEISTFAPGLALASARHETQYTRLFRS
jgi:urease accessory protein